MATGKEHRSSTEPKGTNDKRDLPARAASGQRGRARDWSDKRVVENIKRVCGSECAYGHHESETGQKPDRAGSGACQGKREVAGWGEAHPATHVHELGIAHAQEALNLQSATSCPKEVLEGRIGNSHGRPPNDFVHKLQSAPTRTNQAHSDERLVAAKVGRAPPSAKRAASGARPVNRMR